MVIGLGLAGSAVSNLTSASGSGSQYNLVAILCGLIAMAVTAVCAHYGKKTIALIPFVIGMGAGYIAAVLFTLIGYTAAGNEYFHIVDFGPIVNNFSNVSFTSFLSLPSFLFMPQNAPAMSAVLSGSHIATLAPSRFSSSRFRSSPSASTSATTRTWAASLAAIFLKIRASPEPSWAMASPPR
jgi:xanthine/uracil permease